jgi:TolB protein
MVTCGLRFEPDGYWHLYTLTLAGASADIYLGRHSRWSSDGKWIAYESYVPVPYTGGGDLEIFIRPLDGSAEPIRLTTHPAADHSPAWSPDGRNIAFVSTRTGENDIWLANLDNVKDRFFNASRTENIAEAHPAWSPDGLQLAWSANSSDGVPMIHIWDPAKPNDAARPFNGGVWAAWSPSLDTLLSILAAPNQEFLTAYSLRQNGLALPLIALGGHSAGVAWGAASLPAELPAVLLPAAQVSPTALYAPVVAPDMESGVPNGRFRVEPLSGVEAPSAMLHDRVDEAFQALRTRLADDAGWDFLSSLEQAYIPLLAHLPSMRETGCTARPHLQHCYERHW